MQLLKSEREAATPRSPQARSSRQPAKPGGLGASVSRYGELAIGGAAGVCLLLAIWFALVVAPTDAVQGDVQRIFYFHVPAAWVAYLAFFVVFAASIAYLWRQDQRWDWLAQASAEVGTVFTTLTLISGSLWGRPIWGTWWTWDARLTTTLILWFIYVGYLLLRFYGGSSGSGARSAAVLGVLGFVAVPINYLSVTWWRTLHPPIQVDTTNSGAFPPQALAALMLGLAAFSLLYVFLVIQVYRVTRMRESVARLRVRAELLRDAEEE